MGTATQKVQIDLLRKTTVGSMGKPGIDLGDVGPGKGRFEGAKFQFIDKKCNVDFTGFRQRPTA